jgi:hypothetical protein
MAGTGRVVAELGRPETPDETAARKAESSRVYRSSQTVRNLVAALLATLAVVAVIVFMVPRGSFAPDRSIDVAAVAKDASAAYGHTVVVPQVPSDWHVNSAAVAGDQTPTWTIVYATHEASGFLRVAQGFDADTAWDARLLQGAAPQGTVDVDGIAWTRYATTAGSGNITYAIATAAGADRILVYGDTDAATAAKAAAGLTDQIRSMREENR